MPPLKIPRNICVVAGDPSGDIHGARILIDLKKQFPDLSFFGIGGNYMSREGMDLIYHNRDTAFMGFVEVLRHLGFIRQMFQTLQDEISRRQPDAVILIDYPGFNLKLAEKLHGRGIPVFYYIAPQAWAWKEKRVKLLKKFVDHLFVIFPFEEAFFRQFDIPTTYVGHPFAHSILQRSYPVEPLRRSGLNPDMPIIAFLPGSREQEIRRHLPVILNTLDTLRMKYPHWQFAVSKAPQIAARTWLKYIGDHNDYTFSGNLDILLHYSTAVAVASGTASLQAAFHRKPMVIFYAVSQLSYLIAKSFTKLKYVGMINILNGSELFPELIQHDFTEEKLQKKIEDQVFAFAHQPIKMTRMKHLVEKLNMPDGNQKIIDIMMDVLNRS